MKRYFTYKLADGKEYTFEERKKVDSDYASLQDRVRAHKCKWIQDNITNPEDRSAFLMQQIRAVYTPQEVDIFVYSSTEELYKLAYDSLKKDEAATFPHFKELLPEEELSLLIQMIAELEAPEATSDSDITAVLGINKKQFEKIKNEVPEVYASMQRHVKKKAALK